MSSTDSPALLANASDLAVLLIDVQPRFLDTMHGAAGPVLARLEQLLIICEWFELPVLATLEEPVDRDAERADPALLADEAVDVVLRWLDAAAGAEIVFACVGADDDLREIVYGEAGALAGIPLSVKDLFGVHGMPPVLNVPLAHL